jgi:hypothetical protein
MMRSLSQSGMRCAAILTMIGWVAAALAEAPIPTQDVLDLFSQRERERSEQVWLRSYVQPPAPSAFNSRRLEQQLWQSQWWLQQRKEWPSGGGSPPCPSPHYPPPPFRPCPDLLLR